MNMSFIVGNLGKDPQTGATNAGKEYSKFSVATSRKWKDQNGEQQESTEWHNVVCWNWAAEQAANLRKGNRVIVVGRIQTRKYEKDGQDRYITEIQATDIGVVPPRADRDSEGGGGGAPRGDIPFAWIGPLLAVSAIGTSFIA